MSRAVITKSLLTAIANAIRAKTGSQAQLTPAQMATAIGTIQGSVPEFLISDSGYPSSYAWPYATMRPCQFWRNSVPTATQGFFTSFDCGALATVPVWAFAIGTSISNYVSHDKMASVSGAHITRIADYAFAGRTHLTSLNTPLLQEVGPYAFTYAGIQQLHAQQLSVTGIGAFDHSYLTDVELPAMRSIGGSTFRNCTHLTRLVLGGTYTTTNIVCYGCTALEYVDLGSQNLATIPATAFQNCSALNTFIIRRTDAVVAMDNISAFKSSGVATGICTIYVPDDLVDSYKAATNWSTYASQIKLISELPVSNE